MTYLANSVMSKGVISVYELRNIQTAESLMEMNKIRHLPVVNEFNELSGIVSLLDVNKAKDKRDVVKSIMKSPVFVTKPKTNVKDVAQVMLDKKVSSVVVSSDTEVLGIVTTDDLMKLLVQILEENSQVDNYAIEQFFDDSWAG